jgi:hypothetical protein
MLPRACGHWWRGIEPKRSNLAAKGQKAPKFKLPRSTKHQAPSSTTGLPPFAPASVLGVWCFEIWNFSGTWGLVLGVSRGGGSKTEMRPFPAEILVWFIPTPGRRNFFAKTAEIVNLQHA